MSPPPDPNEGALRIFADGRAIDLKPLDKLPVNFAQRRELHVPKHDDVIPSRLQNRCRNAAFHRHQPRPSGAHCRRKQLDTPFRLWQDGRAALVEFVRRAAAP